MPLLKGIEYNSSTKGKGEGTSDIMTTGSTENCECPIRMKKHILEVN